MGKVKALYVCSDCGRPASQWSGRCAACGGWGTVGQRQSGVGRARGLGSVHVALLAAGGEDPRIPTGLAGLDRVLGGGLVPGSAVLLAGAPGIGKSTLLLQLASRLSGAGHPCLFASGEESLAQVAARARRLGVDGSRIGFVPGRDLSEVLDAARSERPALLVVDSIQTIRDPGVPSLPGGPAQVRACADALIWMAKEQDTALLLVGHVTKDGEVAGPRTLEHAVDVVLTFEGDPRSGLRLICGGKNRFGPEGEMDWFTMGETGLTEAEAGPRVGVADGETGCATALVLAGRRAFAVDVQALVVPDAPPRRQVAGLDPRRFQILAAVTDRLGGMGLGRAEVYGAAAGGLRLDDPGADLAVAAAIASAVTGLRSPPSTAFVGEVALTGTILPVPGSEQRLSAAAGAGIRRVFMPQSGTPIGGLRSPVEVVLVGHLRQALAWCARSADPADGSERASDQHF